MEQIGDVLKRLKIQRSSSGTGSENPSISEDREELYGDPSCPVCQGVGWVLSDVPFGHPNFGKAVPCACALRDWDNSRAARLRQYSNLGPLERLTFENLASQGRSTDPENQKLFGAALNAAKIYAENPEGWLVLLGASGSGKTHLAAAIANRGLEVGLRVFFIVVPDLLDHLRATFSPSSQVSYDELFEQVKNVPLLILDDLGAHFSSPWAEEKLFQVLNHRFNTRLPTVITSNVMLEVMDESLQSRLTDPGLSKVFALEKKRTYLSNLDALGLPLPSTMTFETFRADYRHLEPKHRRNLEEARQLALNYAKFPEGWLVLMGHPGRGKTHLAAAVANSQKQSGAEVLFILVPDLLDYLRSTYAPDSKIAYDDLFNRIKTIQLLVMDDFGEQHTTPWAREKLYQIVNYRYNARLPTIFTTSLALEEIDSRISSRMEDPKLTTFIRITAPDYRSFLHPGDSTVER